MLHYRLHQDNRKTSKHKGDWYGHIVTRNTYDIEALASVRELNLAGNPVKIDDLAIFSLGFSSQGVKDANDYNPQKHISRFRLRARATGALSPKRLEKVVRIAEASDYKSPRTHKPETSTPKENPSDPSSGPVSA